ncbi:MAG: 16S rRNA (guanine(527)-N(7))-methyltransferase RsmG [Culturomica sp.]|nr:16S rRNA (guanine(527)-N(7))-methyltransferase RsmG [Culturomica sp.]
MELLRNYFPELTEKQLQHYSALGDLYNEWNEKINVISRKDIDSLYIRHVLHSLAIAKVIRFKNGSKIMDVGTGGGFPGIPLAIMFPEVDFMLIDSIGKKIKVVKEISAALDLKNVTAIQTRVEDIKTQFDFIVSRAVTAFPDFVKLIAGKIKPNGKNSLANGLFYLKGGDFEEEIKPFKNDITVFPISDFFQEDFFETKSVIYYHSS